MKRSSVRAAAACAAAVVLAGCYVYQPAELGDIRPDSRVRVTVSAQQAAELEPALRDVRRTFTAVYMGEDDGEVMFAVPLLNPAPGTATRAVHNRVSMPVADVTLVESRELSRWRTAAVGAVGLVALGFLGDQVVEAIGGADDKEEPGENNIRVPLLRIPVGW